MKLIFFLIFFISASLFGAEEKIILGTDSWNSFKMENTAEVSGKKGFNDIVLKAQGYRADNKTEFLLNFDEYPFRDVSGKFRTADSSASMSEKIKKIGSGAGAFAVRTDSAAFFAGKNSIFVSELYTGDFSVEFWLYSANLYDGETVFSMDDFLVYEETSYFQHFKGYIKDRRFVWSIKNYFFDDKNGLDIRVESSKTLVPEKWSHHKLVYHAAAGTLEYFINGISESLVYANSENYETGIPCVMRTGKQGKLVIGGDFAGVLDEFRISRDSTENTDFSAGFSFPFGVYQSNIIDLKHSKSQLKKINISEKTPEDTDIHYFYILSDDLSVPDENDPQWIPFEPGENFSSTGRFLKITALLFPNGKKNTSPILSDIEIIYEKKTAPLSPSVVYAQPGDGKVLLNWRPAAGGTIDGYFVYFGETPGIYLGSSVSMGSSPIDAGKNTELEITGLKNGVIYYFSVVSYEYSVVKHGSAVKAKEGGNFSKEVSARPSIKYKER